MIQLCHFAMERRLENLSTFGGSLEKLKKVVAFKVFRSKIEKGLAFSNRIKGSCSLHDAILIFKILVFQLLYNLLDKRTEYQIKDRLSFMRFLDLVLCQNVPNAKTLRIIKNVWLKKGA